MSPVLLWFLVGIAFFVVELVLPGFIIFFFGFGAWCAALFVSMFDLSLSWQLLIFLIASLITLVLLRSWLRGVFLGFSRQEDDSVVAEPVSTATGVVVEDIVPPAYGRVKYGGTFWQAEADQKLLSGTTVRVVEQKNLLIKVHSAAEEKS